MWGKPLLQAGSGDAARFRGRLRVRPELFSPAFGPGAWPPVRFGGPAGVLDRGQVKSAVRPPDGLGLMVACREDGATPTSMPVRWLAMVACAVMVMTVCACDDGDGDEWP